MSSPSASDKPTILVQLDADPQPSVFDAVVAIDAGVAHLLRHGGIRPTTVRDLVYGALFTRGPADLHRTALFIGGSDVAVAEAILGAVQETFFPGFRVSVLFDPNGCNTTAAAAALVVLKEVEGLNGSFAGTRVAILAGTGPVGQRVARLLCRLGGVVSIGSRQLDRARAAAEKIAAATGCAITPFATADPDSLRTALAGQTVVIAAGAAGVMLLPSDVLGSLDGIRVMVDLNAVPPLGIEGTAATDKGIDRNGIKTWGALGVGGTKMKIHKKAIQELFQAPARVLDAEEILELGRNLAK